MNELEKKLESLDQPIEDRRNPGIDLTFWKKAYLSLNKKQINVLEWGGGASSIYFPIFLNGNNIEYKWNIIESNKDWIDYVKKGIQKENLKNINIYYADNRHDYKSLPAKLNPNKFDIVIIDGVWRSSCLEKVYLYLKEDGLLIVHDAKRLEKRLDLLKYFEGEYLGTRSWIGKLNNKK